MWVWLLTVCAVPWSVPSCALEPRARGPVASPLGSQSGGLQSGSSPASDGPSLLLFSSGLEELYCCDDQQATTVVSLSTLKSQTIYTGIDYSAGALLWEPKRELLLWTAFGDLYVGSDDRTSTSAMTWPGIGLPGGQPWTGVPFGLNQKPSPACTIPHESYWVLARDVAIQGTWCATTPLTTAGTGVPSRITMVRFDFNARDLFADRDCDLPAVLSESQWPYPWFSGMEIQPLTLTARVYFGFDAPRPPPGEPLKGYPALRRWDVDKQCTFTELAPVALPKDTWVRLNALAVAKDGHTHLLADESASGDFLLLRITEPGDIDKLWRVPSTTVHRVNDVAVVSDGRRFLVGERVAGTPPHRERGLYRIEDDGSVTYLACVNATKIVDVIP